MLRTINISKAFGPQTLFDELNLSINEGDRIGIIGPNGVGKSTLLRILAGEEEADEGELIKRKGLQLAYVPQMASFPDDATVYSVVHRAAQAARVNLDILDAQVNITLGKVGFTHFEQPVRELSGGWRKRLTLACGLVGDPELMFLDEPTNHLDVAGVLWLESILNTAPFAWVLVSHDRFFLDRTCQKVSELNPIFPDNLFINEGNYSRFLEKREAFIQAQEQYRESLTNKVKREVDWLRQGVKARTTKAKYRIDAAHGLIEELEKLKTRTRVSKAGIEMSASGRKTKKLVELKEARVTLGDKPILEKPLNYVFSPGKRVGILGGNGTGKTTLLRLIAGELQPSKGSVYQVQQLKTVYFDQNRAQLDPDATVQSALSETGDSVIYQGRSIHVLSWAKRFKFRHDQMPLPVSTLSGGEQARLLIARLMLQPADLLLLDEPTNDLDIPTLEILEESLLDFPGALILVTHDRFMLSRVCDTFLGLDGQGGVTEYADYEQWERTLGEKEKPRKTTQTEKPRPKAQSKVKLSYKEQREYDGMEATILEAEQALEAAQEAAADPAIASDGAKLMAAHTALSKAEEEVARLYERWSELEAKIS